VIVGRAAADHLLVALPGVWSRPGMRFGYQWVRDGEWVPGATSRQYRVTEADAGRQLTVRVTASRPGVAPATAVSGVTPVIRS